MRPMKTKSLSLLLAILVTSAVAGCCTYFPAMGKCGIVFDLTIENAQAYCGGASANQNKITYILQYRRADGTMFTSELAELKSGESKTFENLVAFRDPETGFAEFIQVKIDGNCNGAQDPTQTGGIQVQELTDECDQVLVKQNPRGNITVDITGCDDERDGRTQLPFTAIGKCCGAN